MVYKTKTGHICRVVNSKVVCRLGSEKEQELGKDFMLINDDGNLWAFDDVGFSDPLSFYNGQLYYDHPERFPKQIRDKFNSIMRERGD